MSDKRAIGPAVDSPLPDELARCESLLAAMPLPASRVDRDELLYRAGWAAAQVQPSSAVSNLGPFQQARVAPARVTFAWSCASALVAASLAALVTLHLSPSSGERSDTMMEAASGDLSAHDVVETPAAAVMPDKLISVRPPLPWRETWNASLLTMRDRALRGEWDDLRTETPLTLAGLPSVDDELRRSKTSRELLQELISPQS